MSSEIFKNIAIYSIEIYERDCTLETFEKNKIKTLKLSSKNSKEILSVDLKSSPQMRKDDMSILITINDTKFTLFFSCLEDFSRFDNWLKQSKKEVETDHDLLILESFETNLKTNKFVGYNSQEYLKTKIEDFIKEYDPFTHYGPFTIICQSSGFGKSRACASLSEKEFFVVFCCLRNINSTGYPNRSCLADILLSTQSEQVIKNIFRCYFSFFIDLLNDQGDNLDCSSFFKTFDQSNKNFDYEKFETKLNNWNNDFPISTYSGSKKLLFIFDEASELLNVERDGKTNYHILRSMLSALNGKVFVLFLDTLSQINIFMPSKNQDPSMRIYLQGKHLFEPIYMLPNWDLYLNYDSIKNMRETVKFENICKIGRPLWGSWMHTRNNSKGNFIKIKDRDLLNMAYAKLIGGKNYYNGELDYCDCLAILSTRLGIIKPKYVSTSQHLVARNMAVYTYIDTEKEIFEIDYPSEPILSEAGAYFLHNSNNFETIIKKLSECVESSLISQGEKGEIISKLILISAKDKTRPFYISNGPLKYLNVCAVGDFLQSLYGKCSDKCGNEKNGWFCENNDKKKICCIRIINNQIKSSSILLSGLINFNHFSKSNCWLKNLSLKTSLKRCAAIHCQAGEKSIDLVIPVSINSNNFDSISAIIIQVKLHHKPSQPKFCSVFENVNWKMFKDLDKKTPYLMIYMQLGSKTFYIKNIKPENDNQYKKQSIIYSQGISQTIFPSLTNGVVKQLENFANAKIDLTKLNKEETKAYNVIKYPLGDF